MNTLLCDQVVEESSLIVIGVMCMKWHKIVFDSITCSISAVLHTTCIWIHSNAVFAVMKYYYLFR